MKSEDEDKKKIMKEKDQAEKDNQRQQSGKEKIKHEKERRLENVNTIKIVKKDEDKTEEAEAEYISVNICKNEKNYECEGREKKVKANYAEEKHEAKTQSTE